MDSRLQAFTNVTIADINTQFRDSLPTEEDVNNTVQKFRSIYAITDPELEQVIKYIQTLIPIAMDVGTAIQDKTTSHQSWLPYRRADTEFFFWNRYKAYLETEKHWNPRVTATLDTISDEIVDLLGDPKSNHSFQRRGLVLGDVQSGKTANYTAICNKAADVGYRIIIVLAGMMENLRKQTQERLDAEFSGRNEYIDQSAIITNNPLGVRRFGSAKSVTSFTSVIKDFDITIPRSHDGQLNSISEPILLVVKKNKSVLTNLYRWLARNTDQTTKKVMLPMLMIDDEADNGSINTADSERNPTAINQSIRSILSLFNQYSYVGITATPFANIFINPDTEHEMLDADLFPRDFIYALNPPSHYIGATNLFDSYPQQENQDTTPLHPALVELDSNEIEAFFPLKHKKNLVVEELPPSMYEALGYFLLVNVIRDLRGDTQQHRSMLIHVSRFTNVHKQVVELVKEWLSQIRSDLQNYAKLPLNQVEQIARIQELKALWDTYGFIDLSDNISWTEVLQNHLYRAVAPITICAVNQNTGVASLNYSALKDKGLRVIAVGGNSLSRGLTLEGLCVSYFYRKSQMYDTLLQMGRWFGYRPNYDDLFKIWMSGEAIDWYGYITNATNEFKTEIVRMRSFDLTPRDFGLKVRQDPNSLIVTARNKMRSGTFISRPVTVSGRLLETPRLKATPSILADNERVFKHFIDQLSRITSVILSDDPYFWQNVSKELVADLLHDFKTHPWHLSFQGRALAEYIRNEMDTTPWDVVLITAGQGDPYPHGITYGDRTLAIPQTEKRKVIADQDMIRISGTKVRVGAGGATRIGLTRDQIDAVKHQFRKGQNIPDSAYLIQGRNPILMLHIIQVVLDNKNSSNNDVPEFLFALGVGFPDTGKVSKTANYMINTIELRNWIDPNEDDEE